MRELIYTVLDLEEWSSSNARYEFYSKSENSDNKPVCQIRTWSKLTEKIIANDEACQKCKEKFENSEIPKCERCGRLQTRTYAEILCACIRHKENTEEKEHPILPHERRPNAFYKHQINSLREELTEMEEALEIEREEVDKFHEMSERRGKEQKQELLDRIREFEERIKQLEAENKQLKELTPQDLINEIESYKEEVTQLKTQLEELNSQ